MKIGILQTGQAPATLKQKHGDFADMFAILFQEKKFEFVQYDVAQQVFPKSTTEAQGWLITGSKCGAYEKHPWIPPLEEFLQRAYNDGVPIVGICFGHQIFAQALGGKVEKFNGGWSVGMQNYQMDEISQQKSPQKTCLPAWHQDQIVQKPENAIVVGASQSCKYAALRYENRALTMQAHPEFKKNFLNDLLELRKEILPKNVAEEARETLKRNSDAVKTADYIADFYRQPR